MLIFQRVGFIWH